MNKWEVEYYFYNPDHKEDTVKVDKVEADTVENDCGILILKTDTRITGLYRNFIKCLKI